MRVPHAQIRAAVMAALDAAIQHDRERPLLPGIQSTRRGRCLVTDTNAGALVYVEVTEDGLGAGALIGTAARVLPSVPSDLRTAWTAAHYDETDDDPRNSWNSRR